MVFSMENFIYSTKYDNGTRIKTIKRQKAWSKDIIDKGKECFAIYVSLVNTNI